LPSRTNGFPFFIELIGGKKHVGSCHTNGGVPLNHPFPFDVHKGRKPLTDWCSYKYRALPHIAEILNSQSNNRESTCSLCHLGRHVYSTTLKVRLWALIVKTLKGEKTVHNILFKWFLALKSLDLLT
jgi:hypothetical protein